MALSELQQQASAQDDVTTWSPLRRVVFRFVFVYLILYNLPFPLDALTIWVGRHVFHQTVEITFSGSGDTSAAWIRGFCILVVAVFATVIWTLLDRNRTQYDRLHEGLRVYVRFVLALAMISYGAIKVIPSQFPLPTLHRLMEPFGDASPMGLLWTFMGASPAYSMFAGAIEMLGGLLLTARRTTLVGALVCLGTLSNVVALNFCYDVPVKLYSIHLFLMAAFLATSDVKRLTDFFVRGRAVTAEPLRPHFRNPRLNRAAAILRTLLVVWYVGISLLQSHNERLDYEKDRLHHKDASKFLLVRRGFHWVNEVPYNR